MTCDDYGKKDDFSSNDLAQAFERFDAVARNFDKIHQWWHKNHQKKNATATAFYIFNEESSIPKPISPFLGRTWHKQPRFTHPPPNKIPLPRVSLMYFPPPFSAPRARPAATEKPKTFQANTSDCEWLKLTRKESHQCYIISFEEFTIIILEKNCQILQEVASNPSYGKDVYSKKGSGANFSALEAMRVHIGKMAFQK